MCLCGGGYRDSAGVRAQCHSVVLLDRHGRYSVSVLVVCHWKGRITNLVQLFTGTSPDTVVQAAAPWHRSLRRYFSLRENLLGDKGMLASVYVFLPHEGLSAA